MKMFQCCIFSAVLLFSACAQREKKRDPAGLAVSSTLWGGPVLILVLAHGVLGVALYKTAMDNNPDKSRSWPLGLGLVASTLIVLDKNRQTLVFQSLSPRDARKYGITKTERLAYNRQLSLINLLNDEFNKRLKEAGEEKRHSGEELRDMIDEMTAELDISAHALSALKKIGRVTAKEMEEKMKESGQT